MSGVEQLNRSLYHSSVPVMVFSSTSICENNARNFTLMNVIGARACVNAILRAILEYYVEIFINRNFEFSMNIGFRIHSENPRSSSDRY